VHESVAGPGCVNTAWALSGLFARSVPTSALGGEPDYRQSTPRRLKMTDTVEKGLVIIGEP